MTGRRPAGGWAKAINVTGDAVVTTIVAKLNGALDRSVFDAEQLPDAARGEGDPD
ncbi:MAG: hypothetical protein ACLSVD_12290 [Eggerthellaceae bacterium]